MGSVYSALLKPEWLGEKLTPPQVMGWDNSNQNEIIETKQTEHYYPLARDGLDRPRLSQSRLDGFCTYTGLMGQRDFFSVVMGELLSLCLSLILCLSFFVQGKDRRACSPRGSKCSSQEGSQSEDKANIWERPWPWPPLPEPSLYFFMVKSTEGPVIDLLVGTHTPQTPQPLWLQRWEQLEAWWQGDPPPPQGPNCPSLVSDLAGPGSPAWAGVSRFSGSLHQRQPSLALTGPFPSGANTSRLEIDPSDTAYLGHADHQMPCGLRSLSRAAVRPDFGRKDKLKWLKTNRKCRGARAHAHERVTSRGIFIINSRVTVLFYFFLPKLN